jgi:hypothetical protein
MTLPRPRRIFGRERLSHLIHRPDTPKVAARAVVEQVYADGTVDLRLSDGVVNRVEVGEWYTPATGDTVRVIRTDPYSLFVLGRARTSAPATVDVQNSLLFPYNVYSVPTTPPPAPEIISGTAQFSPTQTRSWRSLDGWSRSEVYQGAYSAGYGYWRGCYFYGTAPQSLRGKKVLSGSIRIHRLGSGGYSTNVPQYIAPHAHATQPSTSPYFTATAYRAGYADWGQAVELPLPVSWLQALVNGSASVRGFGHAVNAVGGYYSINYARTADVDSGRLTIHWST